MWIQCRSAQCYKFVWECSLTPLSPTLWNPVDWGLPGSSVHGIFQARILDWVVIPFSRGSSWPRDRTRVSCICLLLWQAYSLPLCHLGSSKYRPNSLLSFTSFLLCNWIMNGDSENPPYSYYYLHWTTSLIVQCWAGPLVFNLTFDLFSGLLMLAWSDFAHQHALPLLLYVCGSTH